MCMVTKYSELIATKEFERTIHFFNSDPNYARGLARKFFAQILKWQSIYVQFDSYTLSITYFN